MLSAARGDGRSSGAEPRVGGCGLGWKSLPRELPLEHGRALRAEGESRGCPGLAAAPRGPPAPPHGQRELRAPGPAAAAPGQDGPWEGWKSWWRARWGRGAGGGKLKPGGRCRLAVPGYTWSGVSWLVNTITWSGIVFRSLGDIPKTSGWGRGRRNPYYKLSFNLYLCFFRH